MKTLAQRLAAAREARRISQTRLAQLVGVRQQSIQALESGRARQTRALVAIADALGVHPKWLATGVGPRDMVGGSNGKCPVVGYVGAGARVFAIDDHAPGTGMDEVVKPVHFAGDCVAVRIRGDSMHPLRDGWLIFYARHQDGVPDECIGELCVVKVAGDGPTLVKELRRGRQPDRYRLDSWNGAPIEDVALDWAARVIDIRPRGL